MVYTKELDHRGQWVIVARRVDGNVGPVGATGEAGQRGLKCDVGPRGSAGPIAFSDDALETLATYLP